MPHNHNGARFLDLVMIQMFTDIQYIVKKTNCGIFLPEIKNARQYFILGICLMTFAGLPPTNVQGSIFLKTHERAQALHHH